MTQADSVHSTPPANTPIDDQGALFRRTDISPEQLFQAMARLRCEAEAEVERLLIFLDALDGDIDLEPSLTGYAPGMDDREGDCEDEGAEETDDDTIFEPTLGWPERDSQRIWPDAGGDHSPQIWE